MGNGHRAFHYYNHINHAAKNEATDTYEIVL